MPTSSSPLLLFVILIAIAIVILWLVKCINILREYERAVVFRLGRLLPHDKGPGLVLIVWPVDSMVKVSFRVVTWEVPPRTSSRATTSHSR